ncbi:hypothetical protein [Sphingosinicella soli]|uniref:Uncharacterized protein n=1 Tax=Sphingosinicella soli TaxID=333708 RepID=A0A7W7B4R5_9SPHN|nr:hypothetical protein [Sphingosinicella soli]MBB4633914.1 hypothetical protein [Sphingosinicella soli]
MRILVPIAMALTAGCTENMQASEPYDEILQHESANGMPQSETEVPEKEYEVPEAGTYD